MLIVDAHVHIYDTYNLSLLFNSAYANFRYFLSKLGETGSFTGVLLLAEKTEQNWFDDTSFVLAEKGKLIFGEWTLTATSDQYSIKVSGSRDKVIYIVAGRQFNCSEGLEVLSLASKFQTTEELSLEELVTTIGHHNGIAVIPWAFGKWFGKRGVLLRKFLLKRPQTSFYLGDNGGRPTFMSSSIITKNKKIPYFPILPGSDPLPLKNEELRVGSCGFSSRVCSGVNIRDTIKDLIMKQNSEFLIYGKRMGVVSFIKNQYLLRKA